MFVFLTLTALCVNHLNVKFLKVVNFLLSIQAHFYLLLKIKALKKLMSYGDVRLTGVVAHGSPCEIHGVERDERRLEQTRARLSFLKHIYQQRKSSCPAYLMKRSHSDRLVCLSCLNPFSEKSKKTIGANEFGNDLHFWKNGHHRHNDAEDEVEADEGFVLGAVIRLCVEYIEQNHSGKGTDIVHQCE